MIETIDTERGQTGRHTHIYREVEQNIQAEQQNIEWDEQRERRNVFQEKGDAEIESYEINNIRQKYRGIHWR